MTRVNYRLRVVTAILFGYSHPESNPKIYSLLRYRHSCNSGDIAVRCLRMCNVVMIISNEMERTRLIHRASEPILPLCWCVD